MRNTWTTVKMTALAAVIVLAASACATRGWVVNDGGDAGAGLGETVDNVNDLNNRLEEAQERTEQNREEIDSVDQRAQAANMAAQTSQAAADAAQAAADDAGSRVGQVETTMGTLIPPITLSTDSPEAQGRFDGLGEFGSSQSELSPAAQSSLDQLVVQIQNAGQSAFLEIEGHTDNTGDESYNMQLGLRRAEAVKMYLYEQHNVPLHKMNTISYGESQPAAPNDTREGRAQNRRVVVKVRS